MTALLPPGSRRRRLWIAAGLTIWLLAAYPLSTGPIAYAHARGWLRKSDLDRIAPLYAPLDAVVMNGLPFSGTLWAYANWWAEAGRSHAGGRRPLL